MIDNTETLIIAHRGARSEAPENTCAAFDRALAYPIDGIELDVQLSKDCIPVIYHDKTLFKINRTRNRISDLTYSELFALDWGGWFSPDYAGEKILKLAQVLEFYACRTRLFIEIKSGKSDKAEGRSTLLADLVQSECRKPGLEIYLKNLHILSFDEDVLLHIIENDPDLKCILNFPEKRWNLKCIPDKNTFKKLNGICIKEKYLNQDLISWARKTGMKIITYSCNKPGQVNKALNLKVDGIMTDRPGWITEKLLSGQL